MMKRYVIAVKTDQKDNVPSNWPDSLKRIDGVTVISDQSPMLIAADDKAIERVKAAISDFCIVEPEIIGKVRSKPVVDRGR